MISLCQKHLNGLLDEDYDELNRHFYHMDLELHKHIDPGPAFRGSDFPRTNRSSSGNHTVPLVRLRKLLSHLCQKMNSADGYGLKLAGNIPDQGSGVKGNIGVVAYLIKYGNGRCGLDCFARVLIHENGLDVLCRAPDISRDGVIAHNTF